MMRPLGQMKFRIDLICADSSRKTIFKTTVRGKISRHGKEAREELIIDLVKRRKIHHVEELDETGKWILVHDTDEPLKKRTST